MLKVVIKNKLGEVTHSGLFNSQEDSQAWVASQLAKGNKCAWGKPERWVAESQIEIEGEDVNNSVEMIIEPTEFGDIKLYKFAAEYTLETIDITVEHTLQNKILNRAKKRSFGEYLIDKISTVNDSKNLSIEQVDAFMSNPLVVSLREHLWAGNITTFISKLQTSDVSAFFTANEKNSVIEECQSFLTTLGE